VRNSDRSPSASMALDGNAYRHSSFVFPGWEDALAAANLAPVVQASYQREIVAFLGFCKRAHAPGTIPLARQFLEGSESRPGCAREALRWLFRAGQSSGGDSRASGWIPRRGVPGLARDDLGGPGWERDLIVAVRRNGLLWRTETTYREWGAKFVTFLRPVSPFAATGDDVAVFLTQLAVRQRASPATQKQALNALVFFLQEGLKRELGPIAFKRASPKKRMPVVLSRDECERLFTSLDGTGRIMAELAYGAGLRLMELLRLRVQDLDLARSRLLVRGGKGDRDRVTVLPTRLQAPLALHLDRLRKLHAEDAPPDFRACGYPRASRVNIRTQVKPGNGNGCSRRARRAWIRWKEFDGVITWLTRLFKTRSRPRPARRRSTSGSLPTCCGIRLRRIYWKGARTFAPCKSCLVTKVWRQRRFTRT
jgi:integrase